MNSGAVARYRGPRWLVAALWLLACAFTSSHAAAQQPPPARPALFEWSANKRLLYGSVSYRDVVDEQVKKKLSRGLPTTIVMTGTIFRAGVEQPVATTVQTCKITWHVWEEAYKVEIFQPGTQRTRWTTTLEGVLRRCAEARSLLVATATQLPFGSLVFMRAKVQVNPLGRELLDKIKRWVSRPAATGTAGPGDALFGTFTGLFLQRVGEAERELKFTTRTINPKVRPPPEGQGSS